MGVYGLVDRRPAADETQADDGGTAAADPMDPDGLLDVRIGSFVWRGRTPGGLLVVDKNQKVVLKHSETQPGDHVDYGALTAAVNGLK